jgi:hypothetical protein
LTQRFCTSNQRRGRRQVVYQVYDKSSIKAFMDTG